MLSANCEQLRKEDILRILEQILYEFPVRQIAYYIPKWVELLDKEHYLKADLLQKIRDRMNQWHTIRDMKNENLQVDSMYVKSTRLEEIDLSTGVVKVRMEMQEPYYYQMMSEMTGVEIDGEYQLIHTLRELGQIKDEYMKVKNAIESVRGSGYGVVVPERSEIRLEELRLTTFVAWIVFLSFS